MYGGEVDHEDPLDDLGIWVPPWDSLFKDPLEHVILQQHKNGSADDDRIEGDSYGLAWVRISLLCQICSSFVQEWFDVMKGLVDSLFPRAEVLTIISVGAE